MLRRIIAWLDELTLQRLGLIVAAGLLIATWYQAALTRSTLHDSERAFVYVASVGHTKEATPSEKEPFKSGVPGVALIVQTKNSGNTQARNTQLESTYCIHTGKNLPNLPLDFSFPETNPFEAPHLMPPGGDFTTARRIPEAELLKARTNSNVILYVWGTVKYDDIFGAHHKTEYCFDYIGWAIDPQGQTVPQFAFCNRHNCDDRDCPKQWGDNPYDCASPNPP